MGSLSAKLKQYFHTEYQPGERKLVQKIDFFILTFCCLSYFTNYVSPVSSLVQKIAVLYSLH